MGTLQENPSSDYSWEKAGVGFSSLSVPSCSLFFPLHFILWLFYQMGSNNTARSAGPTLAHLLYPCTSWHKVMVTPSHPFQQRQCPLAAFSRLFSSFAATFGSHQRSSKVPHIQGLGLRSYTSYFFQLQCPCNRYSREQSVCFSGGLDVVGSGDLASGSINLYCLISLGLSFPIGGEKKERVDHMSSGVLGFWEDYSPPFFPKGHTFPFSCFSQSTGRGLRGSILQD